MKTLHSSPVTSSNYTCGASTPSTAAQITSPAHVQPDKPKKKNFFFLKRTQKNKNKNERKSSLSVREAKKTKQQPGRRRPSAVLPSFFYRVSLVGEQALFDGLPGFTGFYEHRPRWLWLRRKTDLPSVIEDYRVFTEFFWLANRLSSMGYRVLLGFPRSGWFVSSFIGSMCFFLRNIWVLFGIRVVSIFEIRPTQLLHRCAVALARFFFHQIRETP